MIPVQISQQAQAVEKVEVKEPTQQERKLSEVKAVVTNVITDNHVQTNTSVDFVETNIEIRPIEPEARKLNEKREEFKSVAVKQQEIKPLEIQPVEVPTISSTLTPKKSIEIRKINK